MSIPRAALKKIYLAAPCFSWFIGGQKEDRSSGLSVPPGGFISGEAALIFPESITLGENVMLLPGTRLICLGMPPYLDPSGLIKIGRDSMVRAGAILQSYGGKVVIGARFAINPYYILQGNGGIIVDDSTLIDAGVKIFSANHVFLDANRLIQTQGGTARGDRIGDDFWIGFGSIIWDGVPIGDGAVVAAETVITDNIPQKAVMARIPAKTLKYEHGADREQ